jgi:hypothetical protein
MENEIPTFVGDGYKAWSHHAIPPRPGESPDVDIIVEIPEGRFVATFYPISQIPEIFAEAATSGDFAGGLYFCDTSLVLVRSIDRQTLGPVIEDLVRTGRVPEIFDRCRKAGED